MQRLHEKVQTDRKIEDFCWKLFENKEKLGLENLKPKNPLIVNLVNLGKLCNIIGFDVVNPNLKTSPNEENEGHTLITNFKDTVDSDEDMTKEKFDQRFSRHQKYALLNLFLDPLALKTNQSLKLERQLSRIKILNTAQVFEYWKVFKAVFFESEIVLKEIKSEKTKLAKSIFNIGQSKLEHEENEDLFLRNEDLLIKILNYMEMWKEKNVPKKMLIFFIG